MCRFMLSVDWQGKLYDCDFNQMLDMPLTSEAGSALCLNDLLVMKWKGQELQGREIQVGEHCYGCTAGQGSSCGGALS